MCSRRYIILFLLTAFLSGCFTVTQSVIAPRKVDSFVDASKEVVSLAVEESVVLEGWLFWKDAPHTLLVFHGTAGNLYTYLPWTERLFNGLDANLFIIDYRGYGRSTGEPSEQGLFRDAVAAYEYLTNERNVAAESIVIYGFSLGGGPALYLANEKKIAGLIIESTFTSMADAVRALADKMGASVDVQIESKFENLSRVAEYSGRLLIMHALDDEQIPIEQGRKLFDASPSKQKRFVSLAGEHCRPWKEHEVTWLGEFTRFLGELQ